MNDFRKISTKNEIIQNRNPSINKYGNKLTRILIIKKRVKVTSNDNTKVI